MSADDQWALAPATRAVHAGERVVAPRPGANVPLVLTAPFRFTTVAELDRAFAAGPGPGQYARYDNPTVAAVEAKLAALEGAAGAVAFSSGMAAVAAAVTGILGGVGSAGHVLAASELYGGSDAWLGRLAEERPHLVLERRPLADLRARLVDPAAPAPDLVYLETPTNPLLRTVDLPALAAAANARGARLVVDNTFATPILQNPLALGAAAVVHSATKFLGGHSDLLAGLAATSDESLLGELRQVRTLGGACLDPHAAYLLGRGMKTLALRVERQSANAAALAGWLAGQPAVAAVFYPRPGDLPPGQLRAGGAMLSFALAAGDAALAPVVDRLRVFTILPSLGGVESGVSLPAMTSHRGLSPAARAAQGMPAGLVRLSVGIEDLDDLRADLAQALAGAASRRDG